jgi:4'-phosphopantetheinyl transferase
VLADVLDIRPVPTPPSAAGAPELFVADLAVPASVVDRLAELLSPDERARAERSVPEVRRGYVVSRAALRLVLGRSVDAAPDGLRFGYGPLGKPVLVGAAAGSCEFSLSRAGDTCLIGISTAGPIGVDVERVVPFPHLEDIVRRYFAAMEVAALRGLAGAELLAGFYRCWTRKEAQLKALGCGLAAGLDRLAVSVDDEQGWRVGDVRPAPGVVGAWATPAATVTGGGRRAAWELAGAPR